MADADEDAILHTGSAGSSTPAGLVADSDEEDELQDFRSIASITSKSTGASLLPKRGEKDFEPNPTQAQSDTLAASREAMHYALSAERVLMPRNPLIGQYLPESKDWRWDVLPEGRGGPDEHGGKGGRCVVVENFKTTFGRSFGMSDYRNWTWLLPEEALFLLERGTLDIRWPDEVVQKFMKGGLKDNNTEETGDGSEDEADVDPKASDALSAADDKKDDNPTTKPRGRKVPLQVGTVPMSLQAAYASFIGKSGLTLERYVVYAGLRRLGYIVLRAPTWDEGEDKDIQPYSNGHASEPNGHISQPSSLSLSTTTTQTELPGPNLATTLINRLISLFYTPKPLHYRPSQGPLIYPGLYGNYRDVFRALTLIPYHHPSSTQSSTPQPPFTITWYVHKPSPNTQFRKSDPPTPDFRLAVLDARTSFIPTAAELDALLASVPRDELPRDKRMEVRLRHGVRNVVLAVVDSGLVSYIRVADMCSGSEGRVADSKMSGGGKKGRWGGKKGGRGGGRGGRGGRR